MNDLVRLPLWKTCLEKMRVGGMTYGSRWSLTFFESELRCKYGTPQFAFEMLEMKKAIEDEDGYYIQQSENGNTWSIPSAADHEDVAKGFESKMRRYAGRSITLRNSTLTNPAAALTDCERKRMEASLEKASTRLILLSRQKSIEKIIREKKPKLLSES